MAYVNRTSNNTQGLSAEGIGGRQENLTSTNGALNVNTIDASTTQYSSGTATPTPVIGNALIFDNSGTLEDVSVANPLPVAATFSGTVNTAPTFAQNPGAATPTPAYGLIDSSFRPQVSIATALPVGSNAIGSITNTSFAATQATASSLNATVVGTGTFAVQNTPAAPAAIFNGKTSVTTAGTRVTLAASQAIQSVTIKALSTNTGFIYVGNTSVASTNGLQLKAGESVSLDIANLNTVNIDSSVNGEGVTYIGVN